jgi:hypothetical protein
MSFEKAFQLGREAAEFTAAFPRRVFGIVELFSSSFNSLKSAAFISCRGTPASGTLRHESATGHIWRDRGRGKALYA